MKPANVDTKMVGVPQRNDPNLGPIAAQVSAQDPTTIQVMDTDPKAFNKGTYTHEATHVFQYSRNPASIAYPGNNRQATSPNDYNYGGMEGLEKARQTGKTVSDYGPEKQADMVRDFQALTNDAIERGDREKLARVTAAYEPFVGQLARMPGNGESMSITQRDLTPPAPSVPPATVAGMPMYPSKLLGGAMRGPGAQPKPISRLKPMVGMTMMDTVKKIYDPIPPKGYKIELKTR